LRLSELKSIPQPIKPQSPVGPAVVHAKKRVALVIGNSAYQHTPKLANPRNDATDIAAVLKRHGLQVIVGFDLGKVLEFAASLKAAYAGVFFYAGHGLQVAGQNYLVPIDAKAEAAEALDFEMLRVDVIHRIMEHQTNTNILFLDACRDNPLARNLARSMGTRSSEVGRGLAAVQSGVGTLISFSTQPGNVAFDGTGRNSPYAGALVRNLSDANDDLSAILIAVRNNVMKETQRKQVPWEHSALTGRFYFNPSYDSEAAQEWAQVDKTSIAELETFVSRHGTSVEADYAKARIETLKKRQATIAAPAAPAATAVQPPIAVAPAQPAVSECGNGVAAQVGNERRCLRPKDVFRDCPTCPDMVVIGAGEYMMGSSDQGEGPPRKVQITGPLAVAKFEATFAEYDEFVRATQRSLPHACIVSTGDAWKEERGRSFSNPGFEQSARHPVVCVSWDDAVAYAEWLSRKTGGKYRLLSEAEWEYVTRAGSRSTFPWGESISGQNAHYNTSFALSGKRSPIEPLRRTQPAGSYPANDWGLHDLAGNVWEWVVDCWNPDHSEAPRDGAARTVGECSRRVLRGAAWDSPPRYLRSSYRYHFAATGRLNYAGFRVARALEP
jgi:formylglycine-generating enzyme required for sulfatase activity